LNTPRWIPCHYRITIGTCLAVLLALGSLLPATLPTTLARPEAVAVTLPQTISGGGPGGSVWTIDNTGGTSNGLPSGGSCNGSPGLTVVDGQLNGPPLRGDIFDNGSIIFVNNSIFVPPAQVDLTGQTLTAGPVTQSGLGTTVQYFAAPSTATLRTLASFQNPTAAPITATISWVSNSGANGNTQIQGTSNGVNTFTTATRWLVADDVPPPVAQDDVASTYVLFGPGAPTVTPASVSQTVFVCSGPEGFLANYSVTVPAGATRRLLFYNQMNVDGPTGVAAAAVFNTTPAAGSELVSGLTTTQLAEIVNWQFFPPTATPTSTATRTNTPTSTATTVPSTATPTPTSTRTATTVPTATFPPVPPVPVAPVVPAQPAPPLTGQPVCTTELNTSCIATGGVTGSVTKTGPNTFSVSLSATGPANAVVGGIPRLFLSTTNGVQSLLCTPVSTTFQTTCAGTVNGNVFQNSQAVIRFPLVGGGTADVVGLIVGPGIPPAPVPVTTTGNTPIILPLLPPAPPLLPPLPPLPVLPPFGSPSMPMDCMTPDCPQPTPTPTPTTDATPTTDSRQPQSPSTAATQPSTGSGAATTGALTPSTSSGFPSGLEGMATSAPSSPPLRPAESDARPLVPDPMPTSPGALLPDSQAGSLAAPAGAPAASTEAATAEATPETAAADEPAAAVEPAVGDGPGDTLLPSIAEQS
jgi:hypothetical protein